ncbi:MAG: hypothetical protein RR198_03215 [Oscillospiraceae bacterium]
MLKKDISKNKALVIAAVFVIIKLILVSNQMIFIMPFSAPIDDDLYFRLANSITAGDWLGKYDYLTLSKYPFFAVWLAVVHALGVPYLLANQFLWAAVSGVCAFAFAPIIKKNWHRLGLFLLIFYSPATVAKYTLRVYRDSIFPIFCLLFFVGLAGFALRYDKKIKQNILWLILSGIGLGTAWITREDGFWLLPYGIVAIILTGVFILKHKTLSHKALRIFLMSIPFVITLGFVITICSINNKYYDRFIISDFTSKEFKTAYGNMTRLSCREWNPLVAVPIDVRERMYKECDCLEGFRYYLEESAIKNAYSNSDSGEYQSGSFYWALRRCAQELGIYKDAKTAEKFYIELSEQTEKMCREDENSLPPRSSTTPPIRGEYVPMVLDNVWKSTKYVLTWQDMQPYEEFSLSDAATGQIDKWEKYLNESSNYSALENTAIPYYSEKQMFSYKILEGIIWIYRLIVPIGLCFWVAGFVKSFIGFKQLGDKKILALAVSLGLMLMGILRIFIISYMEVSAFNIGIYSMYLGAVYPILLICCFLGGYLFFDGLSTVTPAVTKTSI